MTSIGGLAARAGARSDTGRVREVNEDRVLQLEEAGGGRALFAIADGLGGHVRGDLASTLAVETLAAEVPARLARGLPAREALLSAFRRANEVIRARAEAEGLTGMATTCTAVVIEGNAGIVAHVGDSRAYLLRARQVRQLTVDHSLASELARRGELAPTEVETHAHRHVLTRALGSAEQVEIDLIVEPLRPGDVLVLATDGLHTAVRPEEIDAVVHAGSPADEASGVLVALANARGGFDNASAIVIRLALRWIGRAVRILRPLALAALLAAGIGAYRLEHAYFLGIRGGTVVVMRGVPARLLGVPLSGVVKVTAVPVARLGPADRGRLVRGIPAASAEEAESMLHDLLTRRP
ncbi:MAG TPA: PP2C family serine/threonine-protein phosphatase [bacterium]|nr:PP2C family serine/threonine-protein phosphatase [bacterium]